jgi:hypothetical protein
MSSRLLPLSLALAATAADLVGAHALGALLVLLAIPCAAASAFVACGDVLEGRPAWGRALTSVPALVLLVVGSAVRHAAPAGAAIPPVALSAVIGAATLYVVPVLFWVLQPGAVRPSPRPAPTP